MALPLLPRKLLLLILRTTNVMVVVVVVVDIRRGVKYQRITSMKMNK